MAVDKCPPKHTKEWETLLHRVGSEKEAYRIWMSYGETIPSIETLVADGILKDKKEKPKFQSVLDNYLDRRSYLYKRLASVRSELKGKTGEERVKITQNAQKIQAEIKNLDSKIEEVEKLKGTEQIYVYAKEDLDKVRDTLNKKDLTLNDLQGVVRIIKLWKRITQLDERNPIFTPEELEAFQDEQNVTYQDIAKELKNIQSRAEMLDVKFYRLEEKLFIQEAKKTFGEDADLDYKRIYTDIGKFSSRGLDIGKVDNTVAKAMFVWNKKATYLRNQEWNGINENLEKAFKAINKRFSQDELRSILAQTQSNTDPRETGSFVHRFSQAWFNWNEVRNSKYANAIKNAEGDAKKRLIQKKSAEYKENTIMFDVRKLFPRPEDKFTVQEIQAHKDELIQQVGQSGYDFYMKRLESKLENYKESKEAEEFNLRLEFGDNEALYQQNLEEFEIENSPYRAAEAFYDNAIFKSGGKYFSTNFFSSEIVPRRIVKGKDLGYYDSKFERIENDKDLKALYDYLIETIHQLNQYLPQDVKKEIHANTLPYIKKGVMEQFLKDGLFQGFSSLNDKWVETLRTGMGGIVESGTERDIEGEKIRQLQFRGFVDNQKVVQDYIDRKSIEYTQETGKTPTAEQALEWKKQIMEQQAKEKSFNIENVTKLYSLAVLSYKYKAMTEDAMASAYDLIERAVEQQLTNSGEPIHDKWGAPVTEKKLENFKGMIDHFMNYYYGYPTALKELPFGDKKYTKKELKVKEEIERLRENNLKQLQNGEIDKTKYLETEEKLEKQFDSLGGVKTVSGIADIINMIIRIKGLGWNAFAPIMNTNVGFFTNYTEAAAGVYLNNENLNKGYNQILMNSKKVTALAKKFDVPKEIQNEVYSSPSVAKGWGRRLAPFYLTNKAEFVNQCSLMVGMLDHVRVKVNGKEMSLYDAYDKEGNLPEGTEFINAKGVTKTLGEVGIATIIDDRIKELHGNYDPDAPIAATQTMLERSLMIFRKWMIMSYYNRLAGEDSHTDLVTGELQKGRWRSYGAFFKEYGAFGGVFAGVMQLGRKMLFQKTTFDTRLNEIDAANMKRNLTEIMFIMSVSSLALLLKALTRGGDDDEGDLKYLCYFYINQMGRLERDIMFYVDPQQFKSILRDPLPVMGLAGDAYDVVSRSVNLVTGGEDTYQSGPRKGQSKTAVSVKRFIPAISNVDRAKSFTETIIGTSTK